MQNNKPCTIAVIPAYEPPDSFVDYATELSKKVDKIVVINDGSKEEYSRVFSKISLIENAVCLSYPENHGKGYALKYAFKYCIENFSGNDIIVTADCDGQHKKDDVSLVLSMSENHPSSIILGSRNFELPIVPKRSKFGNRNIRWIFRLLYGSRIYDTQTGLRAFSVATAKKLISVRGDRFEYEMGVLIFAKRENIPVLEVPIETVYPENAAEHVSHFKTFKDSARMIGVVLRNLNMYLLSSALSAVLDVLIFFIISTVIFGEISAVNTLIATVTARVGSSVLNFIFNYKYVFGGKGKSAILRYYILWLCQLGASYGIVFLFGNLVGLNLTVTKAVGDLILAFFSYQIQRGWVFANSAPKKHSYTGLARFLRPIARFFTKKYRSNVYPRETGVVYVCRHLNMRGPLTTLMWLDCEACPYVLSVFFTKQEAYRQYSDYTFTVRRGRKKRKFNLSAYISSRIVPKLVTSVSAVPVYRGGVGCVKTFRKSIDKLTRGESLIVYPDTEYTAGENEESSIYDGFLYLGEIYKKRNGRSLQFVPLYIDKSVGAIFEFPAVTADNYKTDAPAAREYLKNAINGRYGKQKMNSI